MSFKRNTAAIPLLPGIKSCSFKSTTVTSSGCESLDNVFGIVGGIPMGSATLLEGSATTDYTSLLLRYFAAEGLLHGHHVHICAMPASWAKELPAVSSTRVQAKPSLNENLRIAWRYKSLGEHKGDIGPRATGQTATNNDGPFCHMYDLTKRLTISETSKLSFVQIEDGLDPFRNMILELEKILQSSPSSTVHRVVLPNFLSPTCYPYSCSNPRTALVFLQRLNLLRQKFASRLVMCMSLSENLYSRNSSLGRWIELYCDNVFQLIPFANESRSETTSAQGLFKVHKLFTVPERGTHFVIQHLQDLAFKASRKSFLIEPWTLPPLGNDEKDEIVKNVEF